MRWERRIARGLQAAKKSGPAFVQRFMTEFKDALETGALTPQMFSLRGLFTELVPDGNELVESFNPRNSVNGYDVAALEAAGAVDMAAFSHINNQLYITRVLEKWNNPDLLWPKLTTTIPTTFNGERLPGISVAADEIETVNEGEEYGQTGVNESWIDTPAIPKKGTTIKVTKEAIFHDRTGVLLMRCDSIGDAMALNFEKRVLDVVFGIVNNYRRNNTSTNTYLTSGAYVNVIASNPLKDFRAIDAFVQMFEDMTDPDTGEPIVVPMNTLIVPTALMTTALRLQSATQVRVGSGDAFAADPTDNAEIFTDSRQPVRTPFEVLSSPYVKARSGSSSTYFGGDPKRAFAVMENWPMQVIPAPPNSEAEWSRDIVAQYKATHKAQPAVLEPRRMGKATA